MVIGSAPEPCHLFTDIAITCGILAYDFSYFFHENLVFYAPQGRFLVIFIYKID
jgi:hypothetical protein